MMNFLRKQMKWVMAIIVVAFLLSTFLMYEGRSTRRTPERNADGSMSDYEVAQINGRSLMRSELERRLRDYLSSYSSRSAESLDMPAIYQAVLDQAVLESQLAKEVDESGIRITDADADQAMKNYADTYYPTRETFYQALANSGIRVEDYRRNLARQMAVDALLNNAIGEVTISDDRAVEFYDTMKNMLYSRPEGFMLHVANFNTSKDAEVLREKLVAGGSWDVIVSNDELTSNDIINITREPVFLPVSALRTGAFAILASLDVGEVSPVFPVTSFDFAVGLKTEHVDPSVTPYDEVSADIRTLLTQQEQRKRLSDYEASLRNKAQVVINDEELFARPAVSQDAEPEPELVIEDIVEVSDDSEPEEPKVEESKPEESKPEEPKPEEPAEPAVTDPVPETKPEESAEPAVTETAPEAKTEEPVVTEAKPEEPAETAPATETKPEEPKESASEPEQAVQETAPEAPAITEAESVPAVTSPDTSQEASK